MLASQFKNDRDPYNDCKYYGFINTEDSSEYFDELFDVTDMKFDPESEDPSVLGYLLEANTASGVLPVVKYNWTVLSVFKDGRVWIEQLAASRLRSRYQFMEDVRIEVRDYRLVLVGF